MYIYMYLYYICKYIYICMYLSVYAYNIHIDTYILLYTILFYYILLYMLHVYINHLKKHENNVFSAELGHQLQLCVFNRIFWHLSVADSLVISRHPPKKKATKM